MRSNPIEKRKRTLFLLLMTGFLVSSCSTEHYKKDADQEVYKILDSKWKPEYGSQANYRISDVEPGEADIAAGPTESISGRLSLAEAVALATAHNREYQSEKELLYLEALDLTLARHVFAPQLFGMFGGNYTNYPMETTITRVFNCSKKSVILSSISIITSISSL